MQIILSCPDLSVLEIIIIVVVINSIIIIIISFIESVEQEHRFPQ